MEWMPGTTDGRSRDENSMEFFNRTRKQRAVPDPDLDVSARNWGRRIYCSDSDKLEQVPQRSTPLNP